MMGDLNQWYFVTVGLGEEVAGLEELCAVYEEPITALEAVAEANIKYMNVGVVDTAVPLDPTGKEEDGYRLVEWFGTPYTLQSPAEVENCEGKMPVGTVVVQGKYLTKIATAPRWHEMNRSNNPAKLFGMRNILDADITLMGYKKGSHEPPRPPGKQPKRYKEKRYTEQTAQKFVKRVKGSDHTRFQLEKKKRPDIKALELTVDRPPERREKATDALTKKRKAERELVAGMLD